MAPRTRRSQTIETADKTLENELLLGPSTDRDTALAPNKRGKKRQTANAGRQVNANTRGASCETLFCQAYLRL